MGFDTIEINLVTYNFGQETCKEPASGICIHMQFIVFSDGWPFAMCHFFLSPSFTFPLVIYWTRKKINWSKKEHSKCYYMNSYLPSSLHIRILSSKILTKQKFAFEFPYQKSHCQKKTAGDVAWRRSV